MRRAEAVRYLLDEPDVPRRKTTCAPDINSPPYIVESYVPGYLCTQSSSNGITYRSAQRVGPYSPLCPSNWPRTGATLDPKDTTPVRSALYGLYDRPWWDYSGYDLQYPKRFLPEEKPGEPVPSFYDTPGYYGEPLPTLRYRYYLYY